MKPRGADILRDLHESKDAPIHPEPPPAEIRTGLFLLEIAMDKAYEIIAISGVFADNIDDEFISSLSDIELLHLDLEVKKALSKCKIAREKRGI